MEKYPLSFSFPMVKMASVDLYLFRNGSENKMTDQKPSLKQPPSKITSKFNEKIFVSRIFLFLLAYDQE